MPEVEVDSDWNEPEPRRLRGRSLAMFWEWLICLFIIRPEVEVDTDSLRRCHQ